MTQQKALFGHVLIYKKSYRKIPAYKILDTLKYNTIPYEVIIVKSRGVSKTVQIKNSRTLCLIKRFFSATGI